MNKQAIAAVVGTGCLLAALFACGLGYVVFVAGPGRGSVPLIGQAPAPTAVAPASPTESAASAPTAAPATASATQAPTAATSPAEATQTPAGAPALATSECGIITQQDVVEILGVQVEQRLNEANPTNQVNFFSGPVSVIESDCTYDAGTSLLTYYVYKPDQTSPEELARLWSEYKAADAGGHQDVQGIGDDAYARDGFLIFKKGNHYIEVDVVIPGVFQNDPAVDQKQLEMAKAFARRALTRLPK